MQEIRFMLEISDLCVNIASLFPTSIHNRRIEETQIP